MPNDETINGQLNEYGDDEATDRVSTNLGRELAPDHLAHLNINAQGDGVVYLRGPVSAGAGSVHRANRPLDGGVKQVVNELHVQQ